MAIASVNCRTHSPHLQSAALLTADFSNGGLAMKRIWTLVLCTVLASGNLTKGDEAPTKTIEIGTSKDVHEARRAGWLALSQVVPVLEQGDKDQFPGIAAWTEDFRQATKGIKLESEPANWPAIDVDALVTNNPDFWRAHYEVAPGDPGFVLLHSGLLLVGCEPQRAANVLIVGLQRPDVPAPIRNVMERLASQAQRSLRESNAAVEEGIKLFDQGKHAEALKKHAAAIAICPQNGFAHYEWGLTKRQLEWTEAGFKPELKNGQLLVNAGPKTSKPVAAAFAQARRHDPFQWRAYQGEDKDAIEGLMILLKKGMPNWEKLANARGKLVDDDVIQELSEGAQGAHVDELSLALRQIVVARRGRFAREDHPFIAASLRRLAPGETTEAVLARLAGKDVSLRQLIAPEK
jgi:hypothetical protein